MLSPQDAVYIYRDFGLKADRCYKATYKKPAFEKGGFFSFTIHYGPAKLCGDAANHLSTPTDNWYLALRIYRPVPEILKNGYNMPVPDPLPVP